MPKSRIPSPARSHGAVTPRRYKSRGPRSVGSPARSDVSGRLTSVINMHKTSFVLSPMPTRRSVLADTTYIEEPKRRSWWRQLGETSRDMMEVIESNKGSAETDNVEELIEMEVLSQERKEEDHLDLPESSGSESIHSIVMPQRKLFKQKDYEAQKKFGEIMGNRETLAKLHKTSGDHDKSIKAGTRELFQGNKQRTKPIFPAALLDISLNKTAADKTKEHIMEPPKNQVRNIFGNRAPTKRRNMFAEFVVSESEDEIPEIQPKVFGFPKKSDPKRRGSSASRGMREPSPASSITTDMEMDDWKQLPSSTMVAEQLEEAVSGTPVKRARLSKLSEAKESDTVTNSNATVDKTKQSNKSVSSKNKSTNSSTVKDKSLEIHRSMTTRNSTKNMQNNVVDNTVDGSFTSKNVSNNKSKISNSSLNKRNSKQTDQSSNRTNTKNHTLEKTKDVLKSKVLHREGNQKTKQDNVLTSLIENHDNNIKLDDNEENNFTLEYESDDHQESIAQSVGSKSLKNKTVTLTKNSNKTYNDVASSEKQKQNTSAMTVQPTSKKTVDETEESDMLKENELTSIHIKTNDAKNISVHDSGSKGIAKVSKANSYNHKKIYEKNDMELDVNDSVNGRENHISVVQEQMDVGEINEIMEQNKDNLNINVKKGPINTEISNQNQSDCQKDPEKIHGSQITNQQKVENERVTRSNELLSKEDNDQNINLGNRYVVENSVAENSPEMLHESVTNGKKEKREGHTEERIDNSPETQNKSQHSNPLQELNKRSQENKESNRDIENDSYDAVNNESQTKQPNECKVTEQNEIEVEEVNKNKTAAEHNENVDERHNESKIVEHDANKDEEQNVSKVDELNKSEAIEQNEREVEEQDENEAEEQNESEVIEHNVSEVEQENEKLEVNEQNESEAEQQNESEAEEQNESEAEQQNESEAEQQNESEAEQQNESEVIEHNTSEVEQENEMEVDEQNESDAEEQNESETEEQNESEAEEHESEVIEQNESDDEEQNESEAEQQNESEADEQNESEVEEEHESEAEEQKESEADEQNESEADEQNESEAEEHESEVIEQNESDAEEQNESYAEAQNLSDTENQEGSEDVIEQTETPNSSGIKSPEAVLHDKTNRGDSFTTQGRNTSVRKTKSMIRPLNIQPSLAPLRDSIGFSDGTKNSTAEGSGWDSHRTTRKTLRQTFGRDFSPRKSLRALVMEKSAKRQTAYMDGRTDITSLPQANSTEFPESSNRDYEETMESDHELSRRTRQATLEMCLDQIKKKNLERWEKVGEQVRNMFKTSNKENVRFKEPQPIFEPLRKTKQAKSKSKDKQLGSLMPMDYLPSEILEDMKYKPPKRFQPRNVSWITKRLYKFLETKLEPRYDYKARVRAEKLVETIYNFAKGLKRHQVAPTDAVEVLKHEMARLDIVKTHFEFYEFFKNYMPREIRIKVIPDIVNKIPMPKHGIFSDILH